MISGILKRIGNRILNREGDLIDWTRANFANMNSTLPAVNVKEIENEYQIDLAAPDLQKNDFNVTYDNGMLTISLEKKTI